MRTCKKLINHFSPSSSFGADVSLFEHLEDDLNVVPLNVQYRMNSRLADLANGLVYDREGKGGGLVCGSEEVASR